MGLAILGSLSEEETSQKQTEGQEQIQEVASVEKSADMSVKNSEIYETEIPEEYNSEIPKETTEVIYSKSKQEEKIANKEIEEIENIKALETEAELPKEEIMEESDVTKEPEEIAVEKITEEPDATVFPEETAVAEITSEIIENVEISQVEEENKEYNQEAINLTGIKVYENTTKRYVTSTFLKDNGSYYEGETVVTTVEVDKLKSDYFKVKSGFFTSIEVELAEKNDLDKLAEENRVTVIGTVSDISFWLERVTISDAYVIAIGDTSDYDQKIINQKKNQKKYVKKLKKKENAKEKEKKKKEEEKKKREEKKKEEKFKASCEEYDWLEVEMNTKAYKGDNIRIEGTVYGVFEKSWYDELMSIDSFVVEDVYGNLWSINCYDENMTFKKGNKITVYGEIEGLKTVGNKEKDIWLDIPHIYGVFVTK